MRLRALAAAAALAAACVLAPPASAHGPTVKVAYSALRPATLTIRVGTTVHFQNTNASGGTCTIVFDEGGLESPPLARAEGWHHTFEQAGRYTYHLKEMPGRKGAVVVAPEG